ncbi:MAG TPA: quinolinate synthase NadA [Chryseosolibacter sp.]|nr:quinolinate synthase NadA [Chryseosolibacter sp.]
MKIQVVDQKKLQTEIRRVKLDKKIVLLAHYYQQPEIQDLADYVGDSLGLSQCAASVKAETIVFAGVHFMAQTAKILNPEAKVLLPDLEAGCSLADSCQPPEFENFLKAYPGHKVISYINCSAEIKAMSDIICTSSNAEKIVRSLPEDQPIIFAPDKNLGRYLIKKTGRDMVLWDGACIVHEAFSIEKLLKLHEQFPDARIVAHPESESHLLQVAHYVGSTTGMINYVRKHQGEKYIIATEAGILHAMQKEVPDKILIPAPSHEDNTCACSECGFMKKNTLAKLLSCMVNETPAIEVEESLRLKALVPIQRMLEISKN